MSDQDQQPTQLDKIRQEQESIATTGQVPKSLGAAYRTVFGPGLGEEVLADMLDTLGMFDVIRDEGGMHRHNHCVGILTIMGVIKRDRSGVRNTRQLVQALGTIAGSTERSN